LPGLGAFAGWPDELICYFLHRLDVPELLTLAQTSKLMRVFVCEEPLWLQKHLERCARPFSYRVIAGSAEADNSNAPGCTPEAVCADATAASLRTLSLGLARCSTAAEEVTRLPSHLCRDPGV
jgi:hypothetical protein